MNKLASWLRIPLITLSALALGTLAQAEPLDFDPGAPPGFTPDEPPAFTPGTPPSFDLVPELAVAFFGNDLYKFPGSQNQTSQWYFSFTFKSVYHFTGDNWFFFDEFNSLFYVNTSIGNLASGFWAYMMAPGGHSTWVFIARDGNFYDLRDSNFDGNNDLSDDQAGDQTLTGFMFVQTPFPGDPAGSQWYFFSQYPSGNWIINMGLSSPAADDWHQLR